MCVVREDIWCNKSCKSDNAAELSTVHWISKKVVIIYNPKFPWQHTYLHSLILKQRSVNYNQSCLDNATTKFKCILYF